MFRFLGLSLGPWWLLMTAGLMLWERCNPERNIAALRLHWHAVCLTGMAVTSLWFVVMVDHGSIHRHFLYRHLFLLFFLMILFTASRIRAEAFTAIRLLRRTGAISLSGS